MEGHPIQVLKKNETTNLFELNSEFSNILSKKEIKNCYIAIISIAGAFRKGKSFFLNFLLRYLHAEYDLDDSLNWMGAEETSLAGFEWCGGTERQTIGIWIWSKLFKKVLSNGESVCVMLMDTEGIFDDKTTKENVTLFSLSTMLSSIQIFNIFTHIQEDDLQHLQQFTEYARIARNENNSEKFQKLLFLIRDWCNPLQYNLGLEGGHEYLQNKLMVTQNQLAEQMSIRRYFKSAYEHLDCALLPHPGKKVARSAEFIFNGEIENIDDEFVSVIEQIVPEILNPEHVLQKKINGQKIRAHELVAFANLYLAYFNSDEMSPQTMYQENINLCILQAKDAATEDYNDNMNQATELQIYIDPERFRETHERFYTSAVEIFNTRTEFIERNVSSIWLTRLKEGLKHQYSLFSGRNYSYKSVIEKTTDYVSENPVKCVVAVVGAIGTVGAIGAVGAVGGAVGAVELMGSVGAAEALAAAGATGIVDAIATVGATEVISSIAGVAARGAVQAIVTVAAELMGPERLLL